MDYCVMNNKGFFLMACDMLTTYEVEKQQLPNVG